MGSGGTSAQFVGRAAELQLLDELLAGTQAGDSVTALVCGEAGSGKTRLTSEVVATARRREMVTLVGSCTMVGATSLAFAPFAEALRPLVREHSVSGSDDGGSRTTWVGRLVAPSRRSSALDPLGELTELGLFEEVLDTLERAGAASGLLVLIDDLHWADPSSRGLFEFLARTLRGTKVFLLGTVRTDDPDDPVFLAWLAEVQRVPRAIRINLEPFGRSEVAELMAGVLGHAPSGELAGRVYERSAGNAFLAELLAADAQGDRVPGTVRDLVLARVTALSSRARDLVRLAAVAGIRVRHDLMAAASGLDDDTLLEAARELTASHLLFVDGSGEGYAFRHALAREAVYEDLLPGERRRLHLAAARALSRELPRDPAEGCAVIEAVAAHWYAAGALEQALPAAVAAGDAARGVLALTDALGHYERALELWDQVADPEQRTGVARPVLLERASVAASGAGDHDRAILYIDAAIDELQRAGDAEEQLALLYAKKSPYMWRSGRDVEAAEWRARAVALVSPGPPTPGRAAVLAEHAHGLCWYQRYEEATQVAEAALEAACSTGAREAEAVARTALGVCLLMTSPDPEAGLQELERVIAIGREIGDAEETVEGYAVLSYCLATLGRLDDAAIAAAKAAEVGAEMGALRSWVGHAVANGAEALFLAGRWDECEQALARLREKRCGGFVELVGLVLMALLEACRGRDGPALAAIGAAGQLGVDETQVQGLLQAARAQIALNSGDLDAAHEAVVEGLRALSECQAHPEVVLLEALTHLGLQVGADRALLANARRDGPGEQGAIESIRATAAQARALWARTYGAAHRPAAMRALEAVHHAELARAKGRAEPDSWAEVSASAVGEGAHRTAYARFREAEAVLATRGDRARAVSALIAARSTASLLEAAPLSRDVDDLARRARIDLEDHGASATSSPLAHPGIGASGLTAREIEVLRLLAAGYTNPQIGEALYISRKTASHHVSSILTKLGVTTRVEAAGVAHRLGITLGSMPAK